MLLCIKVLFPLIIFWDASLDIFCNKALEEFFRGKLPRRKFFLVKLFVENSLAENFYKVNSLKENSHGENALVFISVIFS